jgi:arsenite methyltransferase
LQRGLQVALMSGHGQMDRLRLNPQTHFVPDTERWICPWVDTGVNRAGIEHCRSALLGISFGGYFMLRATAVDDRVAAVVANSPVVDRRAYLTSFVGFDPEEMLSAEEDFSIADIDTIPDEEMPPTQKEMTRSLIRRFGQPQISRRTRLDLLTAPARHRDPSCRVLRSSPTRGLAIRVARDALQPILVRNRFGESVDRRHVRDVVADRRLVGLLTLEPRKRPGPALDGEVFRGRPAMLRRGRWQEHTMTLAFDADLSARIEATYRTPDVVAQRRTILDVVDPRPGEKALDIGSGPALLAAQIAERIRPSGSVHGLDPSQSMLALSAERAATAGVTLAAGVATELPYADSVFDIVTATQVYEYVPDMPAALAEARRVLRPGGRLLVLDTDWDSVVWHSSNPQRMRRVLAAWNEHLADAHLPRRLNRLLTEAGFTVARCEVVPLLNSSYHPQTYSAGLIGFIAGFVPGRAGLTVDEVEAWRADLEALGLDYFCSVNRYLFLAMAA